MIIIALNFSWISSKQQKKNWVHPFWFYNGINILARLFTYRSHCALFSPFCMHAKMFAASVSARLGLRTSAGVSTHTHTHTLTWHVSTSLCCSSAAAVALFALLLLLFFAVSFLIITQTAPMPAGIFNRVAAAATASASSARAVCCCGCCLCPRRG